MNEDILKQASDEEIDMIYYPLEKFSDHMMNSVCYHICLIEHIKRLYDELELFTRDIEVDYSVELLLCLTAKWLNETALELVMRGQCIPSRARMLSTYESCEEFSEEFYKKYGLDIKRFEKGFDIY